ncbi:MAG: HAD family phosphatase [bacterium]|nr:HAD family phosphatase [bacterium]
MIKTVIFDIGNVMVDFCYREMLKRKGYSEEICERIAAATVDSGFWNELDRGVMGYDEVVSLFAARDPEIAPQMREALSDLSGIVKLRPHAVPWVRGLKRAGYQVLALSNYPEKAYEDGREQLCFLDDMDGFILSYRDKVVKPDKAIYELLQARYAFLPEECVFIDDLQENLDTADKLHWHTIRYQSYEQVCAQLEELGVRAD